MAKNKQHNRASFNSKSRRTLTAFVNSCRARLEAACANADWTDDSWPGLGITFGNLDQTSRILDPAKVMEQPFLDFAKSYCIYFPLSAARIELRALKCVERALSERGERPDILNLSSSILDRAAVLAREHFEAGTAYRIGQHLVVIGTFVTEKKLAPQPLHWKNPIPREADDRRRTGPKALKERQKKLPNLLALTALGRIFASDPKEPRDVFTTCTTALELSAPLRITALLALRVDCEIDEKKRDGSSAYGRRSQPKKGASSRVTWVHKGMVEIARKAIARLRSMTAEARKLAAWLEEHPKEFYRHPDCPRVPEDQPLTLEQTAMALGIGSQKRFNIAERLRRLDLPCKDGQNSLRSLNRWLHKRLPAGFPWYDRKRKVKFSEALFCLRAHELRTDMHALPLMLWKPTSNTFNRDLESKHEPSIFDRHRAQFSDLQPFKITSHQLRHYISTLSEIGGMSQDLLAEWAARKNVKQNRTYNSMVDRDFLTLFKQHDESLKLDRQLEEIASTITASLPMTRQEFNALIHPTAHITIVGFCVHDWLTQNCPRHMDCMLCTEQIVVKGDSRIKELRECLEHTVKVRIEAEKAIAAGISEAGKWYEHHLITEKAMIEMLQILEDPTIENGTIIRLRRDDQFSPLKRALESHGLLGEQNLIPVSKLTTGVCRGV